jgi:hypothetical protein
MISYRIMLFLHLGARKGDVSYQDCSTGFEWKFKDKFDGEKHHYYVGGHFRIPFIFLTRSFETRLSISLVFMRKFIT